MSPSLDALTREDPPASGSITPMARRRSACWEELLPAIEQFLARTGAIDGLLLAEQELIERSEMEAVRDRVQAATAAESLTAA